MTGTFTDSAGKTHELGPDGKAVTAPLAGAEPVKQLPPLEDDYILGIRRWFRQDSTWLLRELHLAQQGALPKARELANPLAVRKPEPKPVSPVAASAPVKAA
jgi:hypothetical protein